MNIKKLFGILLVLAVPLAAWAGIAGAQTFRTGDNVTVGRDQTVDDTVWMSGRNLDIAGTVNGDIFCAAQNVTISGTVNGDVLCAAQTIRISGDVNGDVRLAAQTVTLSSAVTGSASIAAQTVALDQGGSIGRDASVAAQEVNINGPVARDAALAGTNIVLTNTVGGDVKATTERLRLSSEARVEGNLTYTSDNRADIAGGAAVAGTTQRYDPPREDRDDGLAGFRALFNLYQVLAMLLIALAFVLLLPRLFQSVSEHAILEPLKTLLVGLVAALLFPVLFIALLFTVIGIPLALLLLLIWLVVVAFGLMAAAFYTGRLVLRGQTNAVLIMLVGALLLLVLSLIPFLGGLVVLVATWLGIGMILLRLQSGYRRPVYDLATTTAENETVAEGPVRRVKTKD